MTIAKQIIQGNNVRLEPLTEQHLPQLAIAIEDGRLWEIPVTKVPHPTDLIQFCRLAETQFLADRELAFAIIEQASNTVVGSTRYLDIEVGHKRLEIGSTFIAQSWQRTHINTEAKFLLLRHAFEFLQFNRVALLTDVLNARSRAAIARIGAKAEGIMRNHMVMRDGRIRDSALYSITSQEWPEIKLQLQAKLAASYPAKSA